MEVAQDPSGMAQSERNLELVRLPETALLVGAPEHGPRAPPKA